MNDFIITENLVKTISEHLMIDISDYNIEDIIYGMEIELEHGYTNKVTNISNNDMLITFKIVMAHLMQYKNYYKSLATMIHSLN